MKFITPKLIILLTFIIFITCFLSATIGLFEIPDSYFYVGLGQFLMTGTGPAVGPFNYTIPQTLFAPVYALFLYPFLHTPIDPLFTISLAQQLLVILSAILMYFMVKKLFTREWRPLTLFIFCLLPFQIIYAFFMMSEILTEFFCTLYLAVLVLCGQKTWQRGMLVFISSILVLTRFAFIPFFILSFIYWLIGKPKKIQAIVPAALGCFFIALWVGFHIHWYHTPLLSTFTGRHLYDNVITAGKFIPKNREQKEVATFFQYVPSSQPYDVPWWDLQSYFSQPFHEKKLTEVDIDRVFLAVSLAGIRENPIAYGFHLIKMMIVTPNTPPYHANVLTQIGFSEPDCSYCNVKRCRFEWLGPSICKQKIPSPTMEKIFGFLIIGSRAMYPIISGLFTILAVVGIVGNVLSRNKVRIAITALFVIQHTFQSSSEWVEGRFLVPLYPFYTLLIIQGIISLKKLYAFYKIRGTKNITATN